MGLQAGDVFGRYKLVSWLGRGGMAETWRAQLVGDAGVTKPVLIKKVLPEYANDEAFISMFISEARISATLSHGNVAQVFDFGRVDGEYFLAMEFVDGQPLHRLLNRALKSGMPALPIPVAVFVVMEMCRGLHYAHTRTDSSGKPLDIVHRDISPDNVLVGYEGQVKIVDFGIAKAQLLRDFKTAPGVVKGKHRYFSPEQAYGEEVDARTDVWATGIVLYQLLCGKMPVEGPPHVAMTRMARGEFVAPIVLRPEIPENLNRIVLNALNPELDMRIESSHAFGEALAGHLYSIYPRFSAVTVANLLRALFKADLAQEGRELPVPKSFLEQLQVWRTATPPPSEPLPPAPSDLPTVPTARVTLSRPPAEPLSDVAERTRSGRIVLGVLALGALCSLLVLAHLFSEPSGPPPPGVVPPPRPILPPPVVTPPPEPPAIAPVSLEAAAAPTSVRPVQEFQDQVLGFIQKKDLNTALVVANECQAKHPKAPACHLILGFLHAKLRHDRASDHYYDRFVKLSSPDDPKRARIKKLLATTPFPHDSDRFIAELGVPDMLVPERTPDAREAALEGSSEAARVMHQQVRTLTLARKYPAAIEQAQACLKRYPNHADCELSLGLLYDKTNDFELCAQHYERFLEIAPADHPSRLRVIDYLRGMNRHH